MALLWHYSTRHDGWIANERACLTNASSVSSVSRPKAQRSASTMAHSVRGADRRTSRLAGCGENASG
jgi:hypothetical protein